MNKYLKIGRTGQDNLDRFNNYPKGSKITFTYMECFDNRKRPYKII
jgi:hypothetical protein